MRGMHFSKSAERVSALVRLTVWTEFDFPLPFAYSPPVSPMLSVLERSVSGLSEKLVMACMKKG